MTSGGKRSGLSPAEPYTPRRRTALIFLGTGTAGAYHAGVWRALHEAGLKVDIVAGQGMGAVSALFTALDAGESLWSERGLWNPSEAARLYPWHPLVRLAVLGLAVAAVLLLAPVVLIGVGLVVVAADFAGQIVGLSGGGPTSAYITLLRAGLAPTALPTWVPRFIVAVLGTVGAAVIAAAVLRARDRVQRQPLWRRLFPLPLSASVTAARCWAVLWNFLRGASDVRQPEPRELARRCTELLIENMGQPGCRELLVAAHDLDSHRDIVFTLMAENRRPELTRRDTLADTEQRRAEVVDLASVSGSHLADAIAAALAVPMVTEPHPTPFATDSFWRGETHRLCDRPALVHRLVDELWLLGVEQAVLVSASPEITAPHALVAPRLDGRGRLGEYLQAAEAACVRDVVRASARAKRIVHVVRPAHNAIGPFDVRGGYDDRSHRQQSIAELMARGYEDGHRQFVEPIMGPSEEPSADGRL